MVEHLFQSKCPRQNERRETYSSPKKHEQEKTHKIAQTKNNYDYNDDNLTHIIITNNTDIKNNNHNNNNNTHLQQQ